MSGTDLQKIRELLPGYLNKTLAASDQAFMDTWMRKHSSQHPELLHELQWLELTRQQLRESTPPIDPEAGWHELLARIEASPRPLATHAAHTTSVSWLTRLVHCLSTPAFATVACVVVMVQTIALWAIWPGSGESVRLMSSTATSTSTTSNALPSNAQVTVQLIFKDKATVAQVREALVQVQGQIIKGPSALGVWRITVSQSDLDKTLRQLKAQAAVESFSIEP